MIGHHTIAFTSFQIRLKKVTVNYVTAKSIFSVASAIATNKRLSGERCVATPARCPYFREERKEGLLRTIYMRTARTTLRPRGHPQRRYCSKMIDPA